MTDQLTLRRRRDDGSCFPAHASVPLCGWLPVTRAMPCSPVVTAKPGRDCWDQELNSRRERGLDTKWCHVKTKRNESF